MSFYFYGLLDNVLKSESPTVNAQTWHLALIQSVEIIGLSPGLYGNRNPRSRMEVVTI